MLSYCSKSLQEKESGRQLAGTVGLLPGRHRNLRSQQRGVLDAECQEQLDVLRDALQGCWRIEVAGDSAVSDLRAQGRWFRCRRRGIGCHVRLAVSVGCLGCGIASAGMVGHRCVVSRESSKKRQRKSSNDVAEIRDVWYPFLYGRDSRIAESLICKKRG